MQALTKAQVPDVTRKDFPLHYPSPATVGLGGEGGLAFSRMCMSMMCTVPARCVLSVLCEGLTKLGYLRCPNCCAMAHAFMCSAFHIHVRREPYR